MKFEMKKTSPALEYDLVFGDKKLAKIWWERKRGYNGYKAALYGGDGQLFPPTSFGAKPFKMTHSSVENENKTWITFGDHSGIIARVYENGEITVTIRPTEDWHDKLFVRHNMEKKMAFTDAMPPFQKDWGTKEYPEGFRTDWLWVTGSEIGASYENKDVTLPPVKGEVIVRSSQMEGELFYKYVFVGGDLCGILKEDRYRNKVRTLFSGNTEITVF
jgi:hypothetical protein